VCRGLCNSPSVWGIFGPAGNHQFGSLGGPGGPQNHSKIRGASTPIFLTGVCGPRGRPNPENRGFPAGPKIMYEEPDCKPKTNFPAKVPPTAPPEPSASQKQAPLWLKILRLFYIVRPAVGGGPQQMNLHAQARQSNSTSDCNFEKSKQKIDIPERKYVTRGVLGAVPPGNLICKIAIIRRGGHLSPPRASAKRKGERASSMLFHRSRK
jgi:hypothetical protein